MKQLETCIGALGRMGSCSSITAQHKRTVKLQVSTVVKTTSTFDFYSAGTASIALFANRVQKEAQLM